MRLRLIHPSHFSYLTSQPQPHPLLPPSFLSLLAQLASRPLIQHTAAPSYFSQYFLCQLETARQNNADPATSIRTLYIDRDPITFRDISLHLQGYHVSPRDGTHFVRLFADAQFYSLPKLVSQLYEESIFISIGHREFQIPRDLFSDPGNSPNFFSLGFAIFFSQKDDLFPGLDREGLIRPPSILPPSVPGRSADTFAELLRLLRGYPMHIRDEEHRASLLRDCRYFNFKGLEQRLLPHSLAFNQVRGRYEITLRIEDILKSGISVLPEPLSIAGAAGGDPFGGLVNYSRPFVDTTPAELVLEIGGENHRLYFGGGGGGGDDGSPGSSTSDVRLEFFRDARARVTKLFEVVSSKLNLPPTTAPLGLLMTRGGAAMQPATPGNTPLSADWVRCVLVPETSIVLDGARWTGHLEDVVAAGAVASPTTIGGDDDFSSIGTPSTAGGPSAAAVDSPGGFSGLSLNNPSRKRRRVLDGGLLPNGATTVGQGAARGSQLPQGGSWIIRTGQWRLRIRSAQYAPGGVECVLVAVKLDATSGEHARNEARGFLM